MLYETICYVSDIMKLCGSIISYKFTALFEVKQSCVEVKSEARNADMVRSKWTRAKKLS